MIEPCGFDGRASGLDFATRRSGPEPQSDDAQRRIGQ